MENKVDLAQKVLSLSIKKVGLLRELRESLKYEQSLFDIVQFGDKFSVFEIATKKEKYHGSKDSVLRWFNNRKVEHDKIYNIDKLLPKIENNNQ